MVNADFIEQKHLNSGSFALGYFSPQCDEQALYISPRNIGADWAGK